MPTDNVPLPPAAGRVATREVPYSGQDAHMQVVGLATLEGADDAKTARDISYANPVPTREVNSAYSLLNRILLVLMSPLGYDRSLGRQRSTAVIESGTVTAVTTVTTVTTCATLSNIAAIGGYSAQMQVMDTNRTAWAQSVRARIT